MGKRKTNSEITGNSIKGNGNRVTINSAPTAPPIENIPWSDYLQSKETDLRKAESLIYLLQDHIQKQNQELARLRSHIAEKDNYISGLLFRRA